MVNSGEVMDHVSSEVDVECHANTIARCRRGVCVVTVGTIERHGFSTSAARNEKPAQSDKHVTLRYAT